jgi:tyrosinase
VGSTDPFCVQQEMIWNYAQTIANSYPEEQRPTYIAAAETLRVPFWDWALDPKLPECMTSPVISINTPTGSQSITNPLYSYLFSPSPAKGFPANDPVSIADI